MHDRRPILDDAWPPDLDPDDVPFRTRTVTVLRRSGFWDDMARLDDVTEADVLGWWYAGVNTVADLRDTGNAAIAAHHAIAPQRRRQAAQQDRIDDRLHRLADERWAAQVWWHDPRFRDLLPQSNSSVQQICRRETRGEQEHLWTNQAELDTRRQRLAALPLPEAVAGYVAAISGQHDVRLQVLLAYTSLHGRDPIRGSQAAAMLGCTRQNISAMAMRLFRQRDRTRLPAGIWLPQVDTAIRDGWPNHYTRAGIDATRVFLRR